MNQTDIIMSVDDPIAAWERVRHEFRDYIPVRRAMKISSHRSGINDSPNRIYLPLRERQSIPSTSRCPSVVVRKLDTLVAALDESNASNASNPLVLIFADAYNPGGCVWAGAGMQEESLFRRTALFKHLTRDMYPLDLDDAIYAPEVMISDSAGGRNKFMSFVACAAPKMPSVGLDGRLLPEDEEIFARKIELVLEIAMKHRHRTVVLGAWGCGAFGCPPRHVAEIFCRAIQRLPDDAFDRIVFAVPGGHYNFFEDAFVYMVKE